MRLHKRIKKNSERKVIHKLSTVNISKNPNIEKEHVITKIKKHEKLYTFYLVLVFLVILIGVTLIIGTSLKDKLSLNSYRSGNLLVEYTSINNIIGDIITLTDADIVEDAKIKNNETYKFSITNSSKHSVKYNIIIRLDDEFIKLDDCKNKLFNDTTIKYNINKGHIFYLSTKKINNYYIIGEDTIPAKATKMYSMNIWIDKNTGFNDRHYHGIIEVNSIK